MRADRFTVKSQEAVATAQRLAAANRNPEVAPEHLLLAVLEQDDGFAPAALRKLSADVSSITDRARAAVDELPKVSGEGEPDIRPSKGFLSVLQRAEKEMAALGDEYISIGHLLLALAERGSSTA
ncbi:MAG: Clp protease N-terminal domain-containing protein, partial [Solirubrobacterales bacterium]